VCPLFTDQLPHPRPCRCQGPPLLSHTLLRQPPPPFSFPAVIAVRGTQCRRHPLLSAPCSLAQITCKACRLQPCPLVRAWSSENHLPHWILPKRRYRPPLFGELHLRSTPFSDSRRLTLLVAPLCHRAPSPSSPAIVYRPSPRNVAAEVASATLLVLRHLGEPRRPSGCPAPPPLHAGYHHADQTARRPTLCHRPPRHHAGPRHGDRAMGARPQRREHGPAGPFGCWVRPVLPCRGTVSVHALFINFQFSKSFFLLKFLEICLSF
jgi:hypothetical protein